MSWQFENVFAIIFGARLVLLNKPLAEATGRWNRAALKMEGGGRRFTRAAFTLGGLFFIAAGIVSR